MHANKYLVIARDLHSFNTCRTMATVSELLQSCLARLTSIASSSSLSAHAAQVDPQERKDELGRLGVWAANIGAHQTGQSSVECRLRDASHTKDQVTRLLEQVQKLLTDLRVILEEEVVEENGQDKSPNDGSEYLEGISRSEIRKIHHGLVATVTQLHQIPIIIHQPAQHDRLMGMDKLDGNQFKNLAEQHLSAEQPAYWKEQERKLEEVQMAHEAEEKKKKELDMKAALEEWKLEQRHLTQKQKEEAKKKDEGFRQRLRLEFGYSEEEIEVIEGMLDKEEEEHNEEGTTEEAPTLTWIKV